ncbi:MAG TPA: sigma factor-like helix-turn-helix DNA-binding protein, partial [Tepidisphaeraceae bacterium]|nr:sigma factor-like helix-turn-helix DNA-binding protein [Tepidisphaeraceae bacterium]
AQMNGERNNPIDAFDPMAIEEPTEKLLNAALAHLAQKDRQAVLLRFYNHKSFHEVGCILGVREDAARKRVERATEKLKNYFAQRGGGLLSVTAIVQMLHAKLNPSLPAELIERLIHGAWTALHGLAGGSSMLLADAAMRSMALAKATMAAVYAAVIVAAICLGGMAGVAIHDHFDEMQKAWKEHAISISDREYSLVDAISIGSMARYR